MTGKQIRFTMYQNTIYDNGNILSPFNCMKLMNTLYKENEELKQENQRTKEVIYFLIECNASHTDNKEEAMETLCQNILSCSYKEAKEKYGTVSEVLLK